MVQSIHPTKTRLIETTVSLLENKLPTEISVDEILEQSGISKGSLYHHFEDLNEVLEAAQVARYASWVDRSVAMLVDVIAHAKNVDDLRAGLTKVTEYTQSREYSKIRYERARTIANSELSPRFKKALAAEQVRLTDALADLVHEAQGRGIWNQKVDPRSTAVFVQAYTLGKIVDDFVEPPMDGEKWNTLIMDIINNVFLATE